MPPRPRQCLTLSEAAFHGYNIEITCKGCRAVRIVDVQPLAALFRARRWDDNLISVSNRMKCRKCAQRWSSVEPTDKRADSPAIGPVTDKEY